MAKYKNPWLNDPVVEPPPGLEHMADRTQFIMDAAMVRPKWQYLERITDAYLQPLLGDNRVEVLSLNRLFEEFAAISVVSPMSVIAAYSGYRCDGRLDLYPDVDGERRYYLEAFRVDSSLDAATESIYVALHILTKYAVWHGRYGRDYTMLVNPDLPNHWPISCAARYEEGLATFYRDKIDRPFGIRVSRRKNRYYVSCLSLYFNGAILDWTVRLEAGSIVRLQPEIVFPAQCHVVY